MTREEYRTRGKVLVFREREREKMDISSQDSSAVQEKRERHQNDEWGRTELLRIRQERHENVRLKSQEKSVESIVLQEINFDGIWMDGKWKSVLQEKGTKLLRIQQQKCEQKIWSKSSRERESEREREKRSRGKVSHMKSQEENKRKKDERTRGLQRLKKQQEN